MQNSIKRELTFYGEKVMLTIFAEVYQFCREYMNQDQIPQLEEALHNDFERFLSDIMPNFINSMQESKDQEQFRLDSLQQLYNQLNSENQLPSELPKNPIDFLYLYSSPLTQETQNGTKIMPIIDFQKEIDFLKDFLKKFKIRFLASPATVKQFGTSLIYDPSIIHFSGHGNFSTRESYLLFEDNCAKAIQMNSTNIQSILSRRQNNIQLAFISSCHSEEIGQIFSAAGVKHVICINKRKKISDQICTNFMRIFYQHLFDGKLSICESFYASKDLIRQMKEFIPTEEDNLLMLPQGVCSNCPKIRLRQNQQFEDYTLNNYYSETVPVKPPHFMGREIQMQTIIEKLSINNFLVITGVLGIGKSALLQALSEFLSTHQYYEDGVIYMNLSQCDSLDSFISWFYQILYKNPNCMTNEVEDSLIKELKSKELLLILDNCDLIMNTNDSEDFKFFLVNKILSQCNKIKICLSTRIDNLSKLDRGREVQILQGLTPEKCIDLLIALSSLEQKQNLYTQFTQQNITLEIDEKKLNRLLKVQFQQTQFIEKLYGNPLITIIAASLLESYTIKQLISKLSISDISNIQRQGEILKDQSTLNLAVQLSYKILIDRHEKAAKFFAFLGLFPGGGQEEMFETVWGNDWESLMITLQKCSLVKNKVIANNKTYSLYPFLINFAMKELDNINQYHQTLIRYYQKKIKKIYKSIGTLLDKKLKAKENFYLLETNIRYLLQREFNEVYQKDDFLEDSLFNKNQLSSFLNSSYNSNINSRTHNQRQFNYINYSKELDEQFGRKYEEQQKFHQMLQHNYLNCQVLHQPQNQEIKIEYKNQDSEVHFIPIYTLQNTIFDDHIRSIEESQILQNDPLDFTQNQQNMNSGRSSILKSSASNFLQGYNQIQNIEQQNQTLNYVDQFAKEEEMEQKKRENLQCLLLMYTQILLILENYNESIKFIKLSLKSLVADQDKLFLGNLQKTLASIYYKQKKYDRARYYFKTARDIFINSNSFLGVASTDLALGYLYLIDEKIDHAQASFENALHYYELLDHNFGRYFAFQGLIKCKTIRKCMRSHYHQQIKYICSNRKDLKKFVFQKHRNGQFFVRSPNDPTQLFYELSWQQSDENESIPKNFRSQFMKNLYLKRRKSEEIKKYSQNTQELDNKDLNQLKLVKKKRSMIQVQQ